MFWHAPSALEIVGEACAETLWLLARGTRHVRNWGGSLWRRSARFARQFRAARLEKGGLRGTIDRTATPANPNWPPPSQIASRSENLSMTGKNAAVHLAALQNARCLSQGEQARRHRRELLERTMMSKRGSGFRGSIFNLLEEQRP